MKSHFLLLTLFFFTCLPLSAQERQRQFQYFGLDEGLSSRIIFTLIQDPKGFIWIGTDYGLNRFDGQEFRVYTKEKHGLNDNRVRKITADTTGNIWLSATLISATIQGASGIDIFNPITEKATPLLEWIENPEILAQKQALEVFSGKEGQLFIATTLGEIYKVVGRKLSFYCKTPTEKAIGFLEQDDTGIWVSTRQAIYYIDAKEQIKVEKRIEGLEKYLQPYLLAQVNSDYIDYTIGPRHRQVSRLPHEVRRLYKNGIDSLLFRVDASYIFLSANSERKIAGVIDEKSLEYGILSYQKDSKGDFNGWGIKLQAAYQEFATLHDRQGGFWFDDFPNGLARVELAEKYFKNYLGKDLLSKPAPMEARGVVQNSLGMVFVAISPTKSIMAFDPTEAVDAIPTEIALPKKRFLGMFIRGDELFAGTSEGEILVYNMKTHKQVREFSYNVSLQYPDIDFRHWSLYQDKQQIIWAGHQQGLSFFETKSGKLHVYENLNGFNSLKNATVYHFHENDIGLWLATSEGLYLLDKDKGITAWFHKEDTENHLPHNEILHLHQDADGYFWLATKGGGLIKWHPETHDYEQFTIEEGLSHNIVYAVYGDNYNNLWLSSNRGIMRFNKETKLVSTYLLYDGIAQEEFNRISHYQAPDGRIYFGHLDGVTTFYPKNFWQLTDSSLSQMPKIIKFSKQNSFTGKWDNLTLDLLTNQQITLEPNDLGFSLQFTSLDFENLKKQQYAYMIEGFDKGWIYLPTGNFRINKLPYGDFRLLLKYQNSHGRWSKINAIPVEVTAPFYFQTWFLLLAIIILISLVLLFVKWRTYRLKEAQKKLVLEVEKRTRQIEKDKQIILSQKEELTQLDKLKSKFFSNISHELRTPLSLILGPAKYAQAMYDKLKPQAIIDYFRMIEQHGNDLLHLVEELLDLTRLEEDKISINVSANNLQEFIYRIWSSFQTDAQYLGIRYELQNWEGNEMLLLDVQKTKKIINNLISNALKFTPKGGAIHVAVFQNQSGNIQIDIADTGRGIHQADLPHLFERFYQSRQVDASELGGMGIGLALAKELAEVMEGALQVSSKLGEGSTFSLTFPLEYAESIPDLTQSDENIEINPVSIANEMPQLTDLEISVHILVVEDNLSMQQFIVGLLESEYKITKVNNGKEAQKLLLSGTYQDISLIISDVMMPEMDGFAFLKWLKKADDWRAIPFIMLTAKTAEEDKIQALTIGVDDYLTKPFSHLELKARIHNLLANMKARHKWFLQEQQVITHIPYLENEEENIEESSTITEGDLHWIAAVANTLRQQLADSSFSLQHVAKAYQLSERQFQRKVKKITGLTPVKYKQEVQLHISLQLLEKRAYKSLAEVSSAVGFHTPRYFVKLFFERFGKNPNDYFA